MLTKYASAKILFTEAEEMGLKPRWETPHGLFSFQHNNKSIYVFYTKLHINSQLGSWMSQDKYVTHIMAQKHSIPDIPFCYTSQIKEVNKFLDTHRMIIQKPVLGQKAENTFLVKKHEELIKQALDDWIFEKYIPGNEYRCLVLEGKVIAMQEKKLNATPEHAWGKVYRTLESQEWNKKMIDIAIEVSQLFQMGFIAVDFILDQDNNIWLLETNSVPGLYSFHNPDEGRQINVASEILTSILKSGR